MASELLDGHIPGTSVQGLQSILSKSSGYFDKDFSVTVVMDGAGAQTVKRFWTAPCNGTFTGFDACVGEATAVAVATVAITNDTESANQLSTSTVALSSGHTANTLVAMTQTATVADRSFSVGDVISFEFVCDATGKLHNAAINAKWSPTD